jgi:hypothetical protein
MASVRTVATIALALGVVLLFSVVALALFFASGGPFGALNDWSIGAAGVLGVAFVLSTRAGGLDASSRAPVVHSVLAVFGGILVVVGAWLVISDTTGFLLAGLVESLGFALFGIWLTGLNWSMATNGRWSRALARLGLATGVVLGIGLIVAPGIVMGLDDMETAPWWVWVGFVSWLGIFVLLPIWSIWFGTALRRASSPVRDGVIGAKQPH